MSDAQAKFLIGVEVRLDEFNAQMQKVASQLKLWEKKNAIPISNSGDIKQAAQLATLTTQTGDYKKQLKSTYAEVAKYKEATVGATKSSFDFGGAISDVGRRVFIWGSLSAVIFGAIQGLKGAVSATMELDTAMAELKKVLPKDTDFTWLREETFSIAAKFGVAVLDTANVLKMFGQAGLETADALKATETAMLAINTTGASTIDAINALIAAHRIFNVAYEDSARVIDKVQRIQADYAIDSRDLVQSITGIGPAISVLNGDIDDLFSMVAALGEAARISGKEVSNSLKRVFSKIVSKEGVNALQELGVMVYATADSYRPLRDILGDLTERLKTATEVEKANIALKLAQVRQYPKFLALLDNYAIALEAVEKSQSAFGDATEANQYIMSTWNKKVAVSKAQIRQFSDEFIRGGIIDTISSLTIALGKFASFASGSGSFLGSLTVSVVALAGAFKLAQISITYIQAIKTYKAAVAGLAIGADAASIKLTAFGRTLTTTSAIARTVGSALGIISLAALILVPLITKLYERSQRYNKIISETKENLKSYKEGLKGLALQDYGAKTAEQKMGRIKDAFDASSRAIDDGRDGLKEFVKVLLDMKTEPTKLDLENQISTAKEALQKLKEYIKVTLEEPVNKAIDTGLAGFVDSFNNIYNEITDDTKDFAIKIADILKKETGLFSSRDYMKYPIDREAFLKNQKPGHEGFMEYVHAVEKITEEGGKALANYSLEISKMGIELQSLGDIAGKTPIGKLLKAGIEEYTAKGVAELEKFIDTAKLVESAKKVLLGITPSLDLGTPITGAEGFKTILNGLKASIIDQVKLTDEWLTLWRKDPETARERIESLEKQFNSLGNKLQAITRDFSITALVSAMKDSNDDILVGFKSQIESLKILNKLSVDFGSSFDLNKELFKSVNSTITNLIKNISDGESKLSELNREIENLTAVYNTELGKGEFIDKDVVKMLEASIKEITTQTIILGEVTKDNKKTVESHLNLLVSIQKELEEVITKEKLRASISYGSIDAELTRLKILKKISDTRFDVDAIKASKERVKYLDQELKLELRRIGVRATGEKLSASETNLLKQEATLKSETTKYENELEGISAEIDKEYEKVNDQVEMWQDGLKSIIGSQRSFFDLLESGGKYWKSLLEPLNSIADSIFQSQADLVAEAFGDIIRNPLQDADKRIQALQSYFDSAQFQSSLSAPLILGADEIHKKAKDAIVSASDIATTDILNRIPSALELAMTNGADYFKAMYLNLMAATAPGAPPYSAVTSSGSGAIKTFSDELSPMISMGPADMGDKIPKLTLKENQYQSILMELQNEIMEKNAKATEDVTSELDTVKDKNKKALESLGAMMVSRLGSFIGASIASGRGRDTSGVIVGSSLGAVAGAGVGSIIPGLGTLAGSAIGSALGGIIGGLFGHKKEEELNELIQIKDNTAALVDRLSPEIFNAPANFSLPPGSGFGGSVTINNTINTSSNLSARDVSNLESQLNDLYSRSTRRYSAIG